MIYLLFTFVTNVCAHVDERSVKQGIENFEHLKVAVEKNNNIKLNRSRVRWFCKKGASY
jgi:hypothetical protein